MDRGKERLDRLLVDRELVESREKAQGLILSGQVYVNGLKRDKPGLKIAKDSKIEIKGKLLSYVSRGGLKLERALAKFNLQVKDKIAIDVGASTGGFTDCLLQKGARLVYAVDVGYGQLAWKLKCDPRVISIEKTNIRYLEASKIPLPPNLATIDVSFISLEKVIPPVLRVIKNEGEIIALIKPQFEVGQGKVGRGGVVKDSRLQEEVICRVISFAQGLGLKVRGLTYSPLLGPAGNIEYFIYLSKGEKGKGLKEKEVGEIVKEAQRVFFKEKLEE